MTRADLTIKLSLRMSISKREAERYLTCILDAIMDNLKSEGRVVVQGFGSFKLKDHYVDTFRRFCDKPERPECPRSISLESQFTSQFAKKPFSISGKNCRNY